MYNGHREDWVIGIIRIAENYHPLESVTWSEALQRFIFQQKIKNNKQQHEEQEDESCKMAFPPGHPAVGFFVGLYVFHDLFGL
jgi:hypothetical protein